jgi:hypothetical protein
MTTAIPYVPERLSIPSRVASVPSAWRGIDSILPDLLDRFHVGRGTALEFGVEFGFSTVALSNYFERVVAVDHFLGDSYAGRPANSDDLYNETRERFLPYPNISLHRESWENFTGHHVGGFDMCHIDIDHSYEQTWGCGFWAVQHAPVVIFHDTTSFPDDVGRAVQDLAEQFNMKLYEYDDHCGLGILTRS